MQLDAKDIILALLAMVNAWFWYDKTRTDSEIRELKNGLNAMDRLLHKIQSELQLARYILKNEWSDANDSN